jgi:acyl carrier protein
VRANRELLFGSTEDRLIGQLWSALGVDPKTTPNHLTLGELGMESMFAVELQQGLEREYEIKLSLNDVKNITVKQMKDFQSGNRDILKNMSKELKLMKAHLNKVKFLIPEETHTKLNSVTNGNPIYFLPPIEGIFSALENLVKKINRPVIGLNWTQEMKNMTDLKEISSYYTNLLKTLSPNGNYDIIGYSLGAVIVTKLLKKAPIGRAVIIDIFSNIHFDEDSNNEEFLLESLNKFIQSIFLTETIRDRITRDLNAINDINDKLKKVSSEMREFGGKSLVDKDLDEILKNTIERAKMIINYRIKSMKKFKHFKQNISKKFLQSKGKLFVIKPFDESIETNIVDRISEFYNLPEKVSIFTKKKNQNFPKFFIS